MGTRALLTGGGTGGHLYPALNLAEALRRAEPEVELLYVGARRGLEARVLPEADVPHRLLPMQPLWRSRPWRNWRLLATAPSVLWGVRNVYRSFDPEIVVGTGGYASAPALLWGVASGRPTALQEQNARPGLVARLLAPRADQIHLGFPEAEGRLRPGSGTRVFAYGNPVAPPDAEDDEAFEWPEGRVLLAVGGSQGAAGLNRRLLEDLRAATTWPADLWMVWVAGEEEAEELADRAERLPWSERIRVVPYIPGLGRQLDRVALAVCRAGAMFVSELAAHGVPAVLVPFPHAAGGHQRENALAHARAGAAVVREEEKLRRGELWRLAAEILSDETRRGRMARAARERGAPGAADRIAAELLRLADRGSRDDSAEGGGSSGSGGVRPGREESGERGTDAGL